MPSLARNPIHGGHFAGEQPPLFCIPVPIVDESNHKIPRKNASQQRCGIGVAKPSREQVLRDSTVHSPVKSTMTKRTHSNHGPPILQRLKEQVQYGAALASLLTAAGCSSEPDRPDTPVPNDAVGCWGGDYDNGAPDGYDGQCCVEALCYQPPDDEGCDTAEVAATHVEGRPIGSGTCSCRLSEGADAFWAGPYAPNPEIPTPPGECCYLAGIVGCTGRPFMVAGQAQVAALVPRHDCGTCQRK